MARGCRARAPVPEEVALKRTPAAAACTRITRHCRINMQSSRALRVWLIRLSPCTFDQRAYPPHHSMLAFFHNTYTHHPARTRHGLPIRSLLSSTCAFATLLRLKTLHHILARTAGQPFVSLLLSTCAPSDFLLCCPSRHLACDRAEAQCPPCTAA